jgi:hypothetical protein
MSFFLVSSARDNPLKTISGGMGSLCGVTTVADALLRYQVHLRGGHKMEFYDFKCEPAAAWFGTYRDSTSSVGLIKLTVKKGDTC